MSLHSELALSHTSPITNCRRAHVLILSLPPIFGLREHDSRPPTFSPRFDLCLDPSPHSVSATGVLAFPARNCPRARRRPDEEEACPVNLLSGNSLSSFTARYLKSPRSVFVNRDEARAHKQHECFNPSKAAAKDASLFVGRPEAHGRLTPAYLPCRDCGTSENSNEWRLSQQKKKPFSTSKLALTKYIRVTPQVLRYEPSRALSNSARVGPHHQRRAMDGVVHADYQVGPYATRLICAYAGVHGGGFWPARDLGCASVA